MNANISACGRCGGGSELVVEVWIVAMAEVVVEIVAMASMR